MKKFEEAVMAIENRNNLKRVRLKLDPKIREAQDYSQYDGYEGYVLSETETHVVVQLNNRGRVTIPKVVLEGKLSNFIKGTGKFLKNAASGAAAATGRALPEIGQTRDWFDRQKQILTDPNLGKAEKAGKVAGASAAKLLDPRTYINAGAAALTAPVRLLSHIAGGDKTTGPDFSNSEIWTFGSSNVTKVNDVFALLQNSVNALGLTTPPTFNMSTTNANILYFSIGDTKQPNPHNNKDYLVYGGSRIVPIPGRYSQRNRVPMSVETNNIQNIINEILKNKNPTLDANDFANKMGTITADINAELATHTDVKVKQAYEFSILHIPSFKTFEIAGYLVERYQRNSYNFKLSEQFLYGKKTS